MVLLAPSLIGRSAGTHSSTEDVIVAVIPHVTPPGDFYNGFICGGVALSPDTVVTAAHCVDLTRGAALDVVSHVGDLCSPSGREHRSAVSDVTRSAEYSSSTRQHDIAVLRLARRLPIGVVAPDAAEGHVADAFVESWASRSLGDVPSCHKWTATGALLGSAACAHRLAMAKGAVYEPGSQGCIALKSDACQGGSGSPVLSRRHGRLVLLGVLSWGVGCGWGYPAVFERLTASRVATLVGDEVPKRQAMRDRHERPHSLKSGG